MCSAVLGQPQALVLPGAAERHRLDGASARLVFRRGDVDGPTAARAGSRLTRRISRHLSPSSGARRVFTLREILSAIVVQ